MTMSFGRLRRIAASTGIVALTFGAGTLAITTIATATTPMTATAWVNMRAGAATSFPVLAVLSPGQSVQASGKAEGNWLEVRTGDKTGWVYRDYLAAVAPPREERVKDDRQPVFAGSALTTSNVNVRSGPGTQHALVGVAAKGTTLPTTGRTSDGWVQVVHEGVVRWIASNFLTDTTPEARRALDIAVPHKLRTTADLYLRRSGQLSAPSDGLLPANSVVDATGRTTADYSEIKHRGKLRWIATRYTVKVTKSAPAPTPPPAPKPTGAVYVTVNALNVRATSAPDSTIVGVVTRGTKLETTGVTQNDRTQVIYLGAARWVFSAYVSAQSPAPAPAPTQPPAPAPTQPPAPAPTQPPARGPVPPATDAMPKLPPGLNHSGISRLNPNAKRIVQHVVDTYPKIRTIYGWRATSNYSSDHPNGRAVDIMIPDWSDPAMAEYGWTMARYYAANAKAYKINYIIYRQSIFNAAYPSRGWRAMEDRGGHTANHYDHIHVSVFD